MPKLAIRRGDTFDREVDLSALKDKPLKLGRGEQNDIVLPDPTKAVSRFHAELRRDGNKYILEDRDSQNGLWVAGRRQPRVTLESGVPVTVGSYTVMLVTAANEPVASMGDVELPTILGPRKGPANPPSPSKPAPAAPAAATMKPAASAGPSKVLVFGGFAAVVVLVIALLQVFRSADPSIRDGIPPATTADRQAPAQTSTPQAAPPPAAQPASDQQSADQRNAAPPASTAPPADTTPSAQGTKPASVDAKAASPPQPATPTASEPAKSAATKSTAADAAARSAVRTDRQTTATAARTPANPRERELADRYDRAKTALGREAYSEAIPILNDLQRDQPGYRDVPMLLMQATNGIKTQAQAALTEAARLEAAGDEPAALAQYQRAQQIDSSVSGVVEPSVKRVRERMKSDGVAALKDARQYDAFGQTAKAIPLYEKAYRYLSDDDPERKAAKERLDALRTKK